MARGQSEKVVLLPLQTRLTQKSRKIEAKHSGNGQSGKCPRREIGRAHCTAIVRSPFMSNRKPREKTKEWMNACTHLEVNTKCKLPPQPLFLRAYLAADVIAGFASAGGSNVEMCIARINFAVAAASCLSCRTDLKRCLRLGKLASHVHEQYSPKNQG